MKKRLFSGLLAASLLLSALPSVALAAPADQQTVATTMAALDIMVGDENGNLNLSAPVTRAEFVKMTVAASSMAGTVGGSTAVSPYPDVPYTSWAAPYVEAAVSAGLITGYLDGTFRPNGNITLAEGVTIVLRLLGYADSDFSGAYPSGQMAKYRALGLDDGVTVQGNGDTLTRQDAMYLFYNLLTTPTKNGSVYLTTLGYSLTASGEIDLVALVNKAMEGPIVARSGWTSQLGFTPTTVYRAGQTASLSDIQTNDVVYYSASMRTVWAYTSKVTGVYQSAAPSASNPSSVTVAGKSYSIETASAAYDLSSMGQYSVGDTVTLLLGRDGGVAAVLASDAASQVLYGVVTATGTGTFTDASGESYTAKTITFTATDGTSYTYPSTGYLPSVGALIQATVNDGGELKLVGAASGTLTGTLDAQAGTLGKKELADDVQILDVHGDTQAFRVYPERLDGVNFTQSMVRFYATDSAGRITHLILNDVTGDLDQYGVLTSMQNLTVGMQVAASYTYNIAGQSQTVLLDLVYDVDPGPFVLRTDGSMAQLTGKVSFTSVSGGLGYDRNGSAWKLSDDVQVFVYDNGWSYVSLGYVSQGYTLTGYYDKDVSKGGCVRVIVAEPIN